MPLKDDRAVLEETKNARLAIKNSILSNENNILLTNEPPDVAGYLEYCTYERIRKGWPYCFTYQLKNIIEMTENENRSYEQLAKYGATILITIKWDCMDNGRLNHLVIQSIFPYVESLNDCKPRYTFRRIDVDDKWNDSSHMLYESKSYSDGGRKRTLIKSHRMRFKVETKVNLFEVDIFKLITSMSAYSGLFFLIMIPFRIMVNHIWLERNNVIIKDEFAT